VAERHRGEQWRAIACGWAQQARGWARQAYLLFYYSIYHGGHLNRLGKALIYYDLSDVAVAKTVSVSAFCTP
jgi:hypothetical protein